MRKIRRKYNKIMLFLSLVFRDPVSLPNEKLSIAEKLNRLITPKTAWEVAGILWDDNEPIFNDYEEITEE